MLLLIVSQGSTEVERLKFVPSGKDTHSQISQQRLQIGLATFHMGW